MPVETPGSLTGGAGSSGGKGGSGTPYASWRCFYEHHYAPLASDLATCGRELRGAEAAASRTSSPIQPFAQLMLVLPFARWACCLVKHV